jgi:hypothetical protein
VDILFGNTIVEYDGFWHANREEQDLHVVLSGGPSATCHNLSGCPLDVNPGSETSR